MPGSEASRSGLLPLACRRLYEGRGCGSRALGECARPGRKDYTGGFRRRPGQGSVGAGPGAGGGLGCGAGLGAGKGAPSRPCHPSQPPGGSSLGTGRGWGGGREGPPCKLFAQPRFNLQNRKARIDRSSRRNCRCVCQVKLLGPRLLPPGAGGFSPTLPSNAKCSHPLPQPLGCAACCRPGLEERAPWSTLPAAGRVGAGGGGQAGKWRGCRVTGLAGRVSRSHFANEEAEAQRGK